MRRILLFAYGTLLDERVQRCVFNRTVEARTATLAGWKMTRRAVRGRYAGIARAAGSQVTGGLLTLGRGELDKADVYEDAPRLYRRLRVTARLGRESMRCWVYLPDGAIFAGVAGRKRPGNGGS